MSTSTRPAARSGAPPPPPLWTPRQCAEYIDKYFPQEHLTAKEAKIDPTLVQRLVDLQWLKSVGGGSAIKYAYGPRFHACRQSKSGRWRYVMSKEERTQIDEWIVGYLEEFCEEASKASKSATIDTHFSVQTLVKDFPGVLDFEAAIDMLREPRFKLHEKKMEQGRIAFDLKDHLTCGGVAAAAISSSNTTTNRRRPRRRSPKQQQQQQTAAIDEPRHPFHRAAEAISTNGHAEPSSSNPPAPPPPPAPTVEPSNPSNPAPVPLPKPLFRDIVLGSLAVPAAVLPTVEEGEGEEENHPEENGNGFTYFGDLPNGAALSSSADTPASSPGILVDHPPPLPPMMFPGPGVPGHGHYAPTPPAFQFTLQFDHHRLLAHFSRFCEYFRMDPSCLDLDSLFHRFTKWSSPIEAWCALELMQCLSPQELGEFMRILETGGWGTGGQGGPDQAPEMSPDDLWKMLPEHVVDSVNPLVVWKSVMKLRQLLYPGGGGGGGGH